MTRYITFTVPGRALGGTPGPRLAFAVMLTGQDGFSPRPGPRLPADGAGLPVRRLHGGGGRGRKPDLRGRPGTVPKAMDILTPDGVMQATVLDPLQPPVEIPSVTN